MYMDVPELPSVVDIGLLGTQCLSNMLPFYFNEITAMVDMLNMLKRPLYLIDVRRDGTGPQNSWSPREFATIIPAMVYKPMVFMHLPDAAPSIELLEKNRKSREAGKVLHWQKFKRQYNAALTMYTVDMIQAYVEAAAVDGGMVILLCTEPYCPDFDAQPQKHQDELYCHRFTLAQRTGRAIKADRGGNVNVRLLNLELSDYFMCGRAWTPPITML
jgi:hypothetical protein